MHIIVSGHHVVVTSSLKAHVKNKLDKLERHSRDLSSAQVTLTVEKSRRKAEATVDVGGTKLHADITQSDMYTAIDKLADKLDRQLIKHKEKSRVTPRRQQCSTTDIDFDTGMEMT